LIHREAFPFAAVLGQDDIKKALIWNIVNPEIGGVLISGEKGTAKSTLVRGAGAVAGHIRIVDLPLNITEDRLIGNVDFEHAVKYGEKRFEPGLLHRADGNILYVDEVNLLSDHIVKALLESASSGVNIVEREGVSYRHDAKFILVGSMNPEEGGLRPQFLDRFGLYVEVKGEQDLRKRVEITRRRIEYENAPSAFHKKWRAETEKLTLAIEKARQMLPRVSVTDNAMQLAASIARESNCAGHRAELVIVETAKAIAAYGGRTVLNIADIKEAAKYALPHRARQSEPPDMPDQPEEHEESPEMDQPESSPDDAGQENSQRETSPRPQSSAEEPPSDEREEDKPENQPDEQPRPGEQPETVFDPGEPFAVSRWLSGKNSGLIKKGSGRRSLVATSSMQGRYVRYAFPAGNDIRDIAIDATLRAAAPYQQTREANGTAVSITKSDIRVKVRERRTGNTIVFVVDASGSMGANRQMTAVKGAILSLLNDAYQKRDKVSLIAFRKNSAELLLGITRSVELAEKRLAVLPTGGVTPLAAGLDMAFEVVKAAKIKDKDMLPVIVLVTDGRATYSERGPDAFGDALRSASRIGAEKIKSVIIDTDRNFIRLNLAEKLAAAMDADRYQIEDLRAQSVLAAVALSL
jgi:magnesium chelatase subunit D